jgi:hypothetical protein
MMVMSVGLLLIAAVVIGIPILALMIWLMIGGKGGGQE